MCFIICQCISSIGQIIQVPSYRRETALQGGLVMAKSERLVLGDNISRTSGQIFFFRFVTRQTDGRTVRILMLNRVCIPRIAVKISLCVSMMESMNESVTQNELNALHSSTDVRQICH